MVNTWNAGGSQVGGLVEALGTVGDYKEVVKRPSVPT